MLTVTITNTLMSKTVNGGGVPPSNTVAPVISGSSVIGSTLTSTTGTWIGTPVITYAYQWKRAGVDIVGETNSTYVLVLADYNQAITCEVTATNAFGSAGALSNSITGTAIAPVNTAAPVISGTNVVGQTLSSTTGTWTGSPTPTYTYQWKRGVSDIVGATSSTYTLVQADATFSVTCVVTATNIAGSANATSNALTIIDADAQAFFTASGLTGTTNQSAINQLVVDLKSYSIWTKMKAIYPFIGGTAALHKWNLKDPQDTNAAFRLVFSGGWTHSSTGALPNGTNAYADTKLATNNMGLNSIHYSYYSRSNTAAASMQEMGALQNPGVIPGNSYSDLAIRYTSGAFIRLNNGGGVTFVANTDSRGFYTGTRTGSNTLKLFKNGLSIQSLSDVTSLSSTIFTYIGAVNLLGSPALYSNRECAFSSIGDGLTDTEAANFYTAVQAYQTTLSRNV